MNPLPAVEAALAGQRYETARRLCLAAPQSKAVLYLLHRANRHLGDFNACQAVLARIQPADDAEQRALDRLFAEDYEAIANGDSYRSSAEKDAGLTWEQYTEKYRRIAAEYRAKAGPLPVASPKPGEPACPTPVMGRLAGTLKFPDGQPVANALVTLGLRVEVHEEDPATYLKPDMHYSPVIGASAARTTHTDAHGAYQFASVPAQRHEFLAVTLDPQQFDIATRFVAHGVTVAGATRLDAVVDEWRSAPVREVASPFPAAGCLAEVVLKNPFYFDFPRQLVRWPCEGIFKSCHSERSEESPFVTSGSTRAKNDRDSSQAQNDNHQRFALFSSANPNAPIPFQISGDDLVFFADLPARTDRVYALYAGPTAAVLKSVAAPVRAWTPLAPPTHVGGYAPMFLQSDGVLETGRAAFRLPVGQGTDGLPPLRAVRGEDGVWRGSGRLKLPAGITVRERQTEVLESGPLFIVVRISYALSNGMVYAIEFTAHQAEPYLLAREISPDLPDAAFEFSLREFSGGRGFLHWTPEHGNVHWSTLTPTDRELARLQESVPWWIPPAGFGYAMTADGVAQRDYVGIFTLRRGDWVDRKFAAISQGPGDDRREWDWPFPEMVGSTISMITAHTDAGGDAFFKFGFFDGERQWGILVSTLDRNDGPLKEISAVQHKNSSPRLQEFKDWRLDEPDHIARPQVVAQRENLRQLRAKLAVPEFARAWKLMQTSRANMPMSGVRFAVDNDPLVAWRKKTELVGVAHIRAKMTLLGRDFADMYSPVGARPITQWAEEYDLIAASGVFTPAEERLVRQFLMLEGHLHMAPDLMNWRYGSRNANFEADRVDVVGTIGLVFHGNPDAARFVQHALELMDRSLRVYSTPGSGRWYENPACYYMHATKCRSNLVFHLARHGTAHPLQYPRWKDVLRWGILLLTPPSPQDYAVMRDGTHDYAGVAKVRRVPPLGDHAGIGRQMPEYYALMSKLYRGSDDEFADLLLWAYQAGGCDGQDFGNLPLLFSSLEEADLQPVQPAILTSRRLEGYGAVFRGHFGEPNEFYLLLKQGPGGYRYHRTEGSIILFADGKPLIYDGGEAGETWRHTTLSFGETHLPLAPGHVERFYSSDVLDFSQGVHSNVILPGEPIQLCDDCHHSLVAVAERRFHEPHPANSRSVLWVKDEYVIIHDELNTAIQSYWHLQAVADGETGNARDGWIFQGRFGTDLQVVLPDQEFADVKIESLPTLEHRVAPAECFAMRHLMLTGRQPRFYAAVLRPLSAGRQPVRARIFAGGSGIHVTGDGIDDYLFFSRQPRQFQEGAIQFAGRYGAVLRRDGKMHVETIDGGK